MFLTIESGSLAVLYYLFEIAAEHIAKFRHFSGDFRVQLRLFQRALKIINQFGGYRREIIYEVERILDLMRNPGGQLPERSEFLGLHQAVLRGSQFA